MGDLKNQIFLQYINRAVDQAREEFIQKNAPKRDNRFLVKGITYEIAYCKFEDGKFISEISSKIPQELTVTKTAIEQYFRKVVKIVNAANKRPAETKMENIVHNISEVEHKERDYVKLIYEYDEKELYTLEEVDRRFKKHQSKGIPFPDVPGVTTPSGRLVISIVEENMGKFIRQNVNSLIAANEEVKKQVKALPARPSKTSNQAAKAPKEHKAIKPASGTAERKARKKPSAAGRKR